KCPFLSFSNHYELFVHTFTTHYLGYFVCAATRCNFSGHFRTHMLDHYAAYHGGQYSGGAELYNYGSDWNYLDLDVEPYIPAVMSAMKEQQKSRIWGGTGTGTWQPQHAQATSSSAPAYYSGYGY